MKTKKHNINKVAKYNSTVGLRVYIPSLREYKLVRVAYDLLDDGYYYIYLESGHNLSKLQNAKTFYLSSAEFEALDVTSGNDIDTFQTLANLFDISLDYDSDDEGDGCFDEFLNAQITAMGY